MMNTLQHGLKLIRGSGREGRHHRGGGGPTRGASIEALALALRDLEKVIDGSSGFQQFL